MIEFIRIITGTFLLSLIASEGTSSSSFRPTSSHSHFIREKDLILSSAHADLVLNIDLQHLDDDVRDLCQLTKLIQVNSTLTPLIEHRFVDLCWNLRDQWRSSISWLSQDNDRGRRPKRFVVATIMASLASGIAGAIWGTSHSNEAIAALGEKEDSIILAVKDNDHRLSLNADHIRQLRFLIGSEKHLEELRSRATEGALALLGSYLAATSEVDRIVATLLAVRQSGQLHPGIVKPEALSRLYDEACQKASAKGLRPALTLQELTSSEVSYGTFTGRDLRLVIHIPLYLPADRFERWRYVPAPVTIGNSSHYGRVGLPPRPLLAVATDRTRYFDRPETDTCSRGQAYVCTSDAAVVRSAQLPSCLWSLFTSNSTMALDQCDLLTAPGSPAAWQLEEDTYLVYHPRGESMSITCQGELKEVKAFQGLSEVFLHPGCTATSSSLTLSASRFVGESRYRLQAGFPKIRFSDLSHPPTKKSPRKAEDGASTRILHLAGQLRRLPPTWTWQLHEATPLWTVILISTISYIVLSATWAGMATATARCPRPWFSTHRQCRSSTSRETRSSSTSQEIPLRTMRSSQNSSTKSTCQTSSPRPTPTLNWDGISSAARELIEMLSPEEAAELLQKIRASDEARAKKNKEGSTSQEDETDGFLGVHLSR